MVFSGFYRSLLLNGLILCIVPGIARSAFEAPAPYPVAFALGNLLAFPDNSLFPPVPHRGWQISVGGARLYGLPEVQPFACRAAGEIFRGRLHVAGYNLSVGSYRESSVSCGYGRLCHPAFLLGVEVEILQVDIRNYGTAHSPQLNARMQWTPQSAISLAFQGINLTAARLGSGNYPLPQRWALAGKWSATKQIQVLVEIEQWQNDPLTTKFCFVLSPLDRITLLAGLQNDPALFSMGLAALIGVIRPTAAWQYHPDLGLSQCYGVAISF